MADYRGQRFGNYRLIGLLGKGGYAQVYLAEQVFLKTRAAIKVLDTPLGDEKIEQFRTEAATIAHLDHPNIVRLLDYGVENNIPYLVMDYAPNGTLRQRHPPGVPVPLAVVVRYVQQAAGALDYAHRHRLIHRDVKPENLLLGRRNEVLLSDFGIAVIAHQTVSMPSQDEVGTVGYMAPEQLRRKPHPASDQYALAVTAYEWLTGSSPFQGSPIEIAIQHLELPPPPLRQLESSIPLEVEQVVLKALEKDRLRRFASVRDFALALQEASFPRQQFAQGSGVALPLPPVDPLDLAPTAGPTTPANTPEIYPITPSDISAQETRKEQRPIGDPAPGDPRGEQPTDPATHPPGRSRMPIERRVTSRRLSRRRVLLGAAALLIVLVLGVGGVLLAQGTMLPAGNIVSGPTATQAQRTPQGAPSSPGISATQPGQTSTTPAAGATSTTAATSSPTGTTPTSTPPASASPTATTTPPKLSVNPTSLTFTLQIVNCLLNNKPKPLTVKNTGGGELSWQASIQDLTYLSLDRSSGTLGPGESETISVTASCNISVGKTVTITFTSNGGSQVVTVTIILS